jgi:hypothetical protein
VTEFVSMKVCNRIRDLIDQSHRSDVLSPEAAAHAEFCDACRKFAEDRERLRNLLAEGARVTVPGNFNAVLNQRLEAVRGKRRAFGWFDQLLERPMLARFATAAVAIALTAVLVPQFFGTKNSHQARLASEIPPAAVPDTAPGPAVRAPNPSLSAAPSTPVSTSGPSRSIVRRGVVVASRHRGVPIDDVGTGVMLVREGGSDIEMTFSTVTVGAQPMVMGGEGRSPVRLARASF